MILSRISLIESCKIGVIGWSILQIKFGSSVSKWLIWTIFGSFWGFIRKVGLQYMSALLVGRILVWESSLGWNNDLTLIGSCGSCFYRYPIKCIKILSFCILLVCPCYPPVLSEADYTPGSLPYLQDSVVLYTCKQGYSPDPQTPMNATCTQGEWSTTPKCVEDPGKNYKRSGIFPSCKFHFLP